MTAQPTTTAPVPTNAQIGAVLRAERRRRGMTQEALADVLDDVQPHTWTNKLIGRIESGKRPLRLAEAYAVSRVLDMGLGVLGARATRL